MGSQPHLLIVDDENAIALALADQLTLGGEFLATTFGLGEEAVRFVTEPGADATPVDLVIMDIGLPDIDGRDAVRRMRAGGFSGPVVMLSGRSAQADVDSAVAAGASEYVTKPFRFAQLLARVRAQLRLREANGEASVPLGAAVFRPAEKSLFDADGERVRLTEKETAILRRLLKAENRVITRETLLSEVWGHQAELETHTLETHIYRLRRKLEPMAPGLLVTELGGYRLAPEAGAAAEPSADAALGGGTANGTSGGAPGGTPVASGAWPAPVAAGA